VSYNRRAHYRKPRVLAISTLTNSRPRVLSRPTAADPLLPHNIGSMAIFRHLRTRSSRSSTSGTITIVVRALGRLHPSINVKLFLDPVASISRTSSTLFITSRSAYSYLEDLHSSLSSLYNFRASTNRATPPHYRFNYKRLRF
jgi:hypothetical protein